MKEGDLVLIKHEKFIGRIQVIVREEFGDLWYFVNRIPWSNDDLILVDDLFE